MLGNFALGRLVGLGLLGLYDNNINNININIKIAKKQRENNTAAEDLKVFESTKGDTYIHRNPP
jgi:hypothetical protein